LCFGDVTVTKNSADADADRIVEGDPSGLTEFFTFVNNLERLELRMTNQVRGPRGTYKVRAKLRRALRHLADGRSLREAAALARMTAQSLKLALRKPHVLALLDEGDPGHRLLPKVVSTFERVTDLRLRQLRRTQMHDQRPCV